MHAYWQERLETAYIVGQVESIDLMEIVANEAEGLGIDPGTPDAAGLDAAMAREWLKNPTVAILEE